MKLVIWIFRGLLFLLLLALAIKNSGAVTLRFFFDLQWTVPLSVVLLGVFAAGAVLGLSARLASWRLLRQRVAPAGTVPPSAN